MRDKKFYREATLNNTFNLEAVEKALNDIQISSFQYLNEIQMQSTGVKRYNFKMNEITRSNRIDHDMHFYPRKWVYNIQDNFISESKRLEYRKSSFYNKFITFEDTLKNTDIFSSTFLIFIDGKIMNDAVEIFCREDKTVVIFRINERPGDTGIDKKTFEDMVNNKVEVSFFMIRIEVGGTKSFNQYTFAEYNNRIPLKEFGIRDDVNYNSKFLASISNEGDIGSRLCLVDNTDKDIYFLGTEVVDSKYKKFNINVFNLRFVDQTLVIDGNEEWFTIDIHECPVSTTNLMVFDYDTNEFLHDVVIELYYPNVYHLVGNVDKQRLKILVFYYDDTSEKLLEYSNHLEVYYRYTQNVLQKYRDETIPNIVKYYMPVEVEYTINNFKETIWYDDVFKFKSEYLRELIVADGNNFRQYLKRQCGKPHSFYLPMKNVNLSSKVRQNNLDVCEPMNYEEFEELRYMFIFRNEFRSTYSNLLFSIDGINYIPDKHYKTHKYEYIYIPCDMINQDSVIEIEKIKDYAKEEIIIFNNINEEKLLDLKVTENVSVFHNDIFVTDAENNMYLNQEDYSVLAKLDDEWIEINEDCFYEIKDRYKVILKNPDYLNKSLRVHIKKNCTREIHKIESDDQIFTLLTFMFDVKNDPRYIRLYRNGRVIPRYQYEVVFNSNKAGGMSYIDFPRHLNVGDVFVIEAVPYKMKEVYYSRFVETNKIIDLYGIIDKPLDLKWYDFYLNGRKLVKQNIEIISPCKMILRDVKSAKNLSIVQNDRDDNEWYGFFSPTDIIDKILEGEDFIDIDPGNTDDEDDVITGGKDTEEDLIYDFWIKFLSLFGFINPDWSQIPDRIIRWYSGIFIEPNNIFPINPDRGAETAQFVRSINPDEPRSPGISVEKMMKILRSF